MAAEEKRVLGFVVLTLAFHREGKVWVGECRELGTSTYARTLDRAKEELREMVLLHLNALEQEGEREYFFKKHNIRFYTDRPTKITIDQKVSVEDTIDDIYFQSSLFPILPVSTTMTAPRQPVLA